MVMKWEREYEHYMYTLKYECLGLGFCFVGMSCKIRENSNFLKKCKMVISVKIRNFSRSQMTKRT